ncbi:hypothetical protein ACEQ8H_000260 [Pleosporales sp. CAS-2024a]
MAANPPKSVCIIGAGPAGLVAAKTFLQKGGYTVTVYESADRVGGMWRARPGEKGDKCDPSMRTNLSRFTVAFSDLSWQSVDLSNPVTGAPSASIPMFPAAWQVGCYLKKYAETFGVDSHIMFNKKVEMASLQDNSLTWDVECVDVLTDQRSHHTYDYLVCASGFFDRPMTRDFFDNSFASFDPYPLEDGHPGHFQHSSRFRSLLALTDSPGKIAVIGGGISGIEAAAQAAMQVSNAKYSPAPKDPHADSVIYHITNRPFYCMPRYLPQDPTGALGIEAKSAPHFLPLDLVLYNLSRRGGGDISAAIATIPEDKAMKGHEFLRSVLGSDQSELGQSALVYDKDLTRFPAYTGITDTYTEFVRSGVIVPVQGFVNGVSDRYQDYGGFNIEILPKAPWKVVDCSNGTPRDHITASAIIEATGYSSSIPYLTSYINPNILVDFDPTCPRVPLILSRGSVFAKGASTLAFVGFYEGPYWSVMEQQARLIVDTWTTETATAVSSRVGKIYQYDDAENMRAAIKAKSLQVPQFWQADYVGLVEEFARCNGVIRNDDTLGDHTGPAFPARYCSDNTNDQASQAVVEVTELIKASQSDAKFVAAAVFRGMQGIWSMSRKITSRKSSMPGGTFEGMAHFHPRFPTDAAYAAEYLYIEEGALKLDNGASFPATRRYIYRYNEATDKISAWFAEEDGASVANLFNTWTFEEPSGLFVGWVAKGHHWCDPDTYKNTCEFRFKGAMLEQFNIVYQVEGPNKDYSHDSTYTRPTTA